MSIADPAHSVPGEVLQLLASYLHMKDIAQLHVVCRGWKDALEFSSFYKKISNKHWAPILCNPHLAPYCGSWRKLFLCQVATKPLAEAMNQAVEALVELEERYHLLINDGEASPSPRLDWALDVFDRFMRALFHLGVKANYRKITMRCKAIAAFVDATRPFLCQPFAVDCLECFVKRTEERAMVYDVWNGGFTEWPSVPWRRSAIEFAAQYYTSQPSSPRSWFKPSSVAWFFTSPNTSNKKELVLLQPESVSMLDSTIKSSAEEAMDLFVNPLPGLPQSHWWWFLSVGVPFSMC